MGWNTRADAEVAHCLAPEEGTAASGDPEVRKGRGEAREGGESAVDSAGAAEIGDFLSNSACSASYLACASAYAYISCIYSAVNYAWA